jgi:hypothetical protein
MGGCNCSYSLHNLRFAEMQLCVTKGTSAPRLLMSISLGLWPCWFRCSFGCIRQLPVLTVGRMWQPVEIKCCHLQSLPATCSSGSCLPLHLTLDLSDDAICNDLSNADSKVLLSPLSYKWIHSFPLCLDFFPSIFVQKHRQVSQCWTHCSPIKVTLRGTVERLLRVTVLMIFLVEQLRLWSGPGLWLVEKCLAPPWPCCYTHNILLSQMKRTGQSFELYRRHCQPNLNQ